jgi:hypothetical protein
MPCDGVLNLVRKAGALACSVAPPPDGFAGAPALPFSRPRTQLASFDQPRIILRVGPVWRALKSFEKDCNKVSASKGGEDAGDDCDPPQHRSVPPDNRGEKQECHPDHANQATDECAELEGAPGDVIACGKGEDSLHAATRSSGGGKSAVLSGSLVAAASSNSFG